MLLTGTIVVDERGTELAYTDSGAPSEAYTTMFAVHGMTFNAGVFERVQAIAKGANIRFVAIKRRNYSGSTAFSEEELKIINNLGSEEDKTAFTIQQGVEILNFIDRFLKEKNVSLQPPQDGKPGGVAIVGWSLGNATTLSAFANLKATAPEIQSRLGQLIHTLVLHEPSKNILGQEVDPRNWCPWNIVDNTIPERVEMSFFGWWISAYYQHDGLPTRNTDGIEFHVPAFHLRPPTIYSIHAAGRQSILESGAPSKVDVPSQLWFYPQYSVSYQAIFSKETRALYPNLKIFFMGAEHCSSHGPDTAWMVEDHDKERGGGHVKVKILKGINHLCMWDDPEITLKAYKDCVERTF